MEYPKVEDFLEPARRTIEAMYNDFNPMLTYATEENAYVAVLNGEDVQSTLRAALIQMLAQLGPANFIVFTSDAYSKKFDEKPENMQRGMLEREFESGDAEVIEQLIIIMITKEGVVSTARQTHRFIPSEGHEWDEPSLSDHEDIEHGGEIPKILDAFMKVQKIVARESE